LLLAALALFQCAIAGIAQPAAAARTAGWFSIGRMPAPTWDGRMLLFRGEQGTLAITPLSDDVVRFRFTTAQSFGRDHSYALVNRNPGQCAAQVENGADLSTLTTASLKLTVRHDPLRIAVANLAGESLDADDAERGIAVAGASFRVAKRLREDEHVYGFGEKNGRLDKRGWALGGYNYVMWNTDTYKYDSSTDPLYVSVPFFMVVRRGQAHGIFLDNTWRSTFDVGRERQDLLTFGAEGGDLNYYFINGPKPKQVVERYTELTGRMPMPPLWSLGYNQCRYSYYPESRVRRLADTFREKKVPADVIWLDIHYQDNFKPFSWDQQRFPDPKKMVADLRAQGFHTVCIVDAHPKKEPGCLPYESGLAGDHFVKRPDGSVFEGPVWPSKAEKSPGPSVFPDFSRPATREWWGSLFQPLLDVGVGGIWNDMNEPSVFAPPSWTMPPDLAFDNEGQPASQREIHNVYGQLMSRATFEGLSRLQPAERPFVLTRASFAGGQRFAAVWPGDNTADWSSLRQSIPTLLGMGLSGFAFVGSDIGGFVRPTTPELYTRWLQTGVFYPFMRSHSDLGAPDKEPWSFGGETEAINKRMIELRYQLLPYIYNVMQQASETGLPAMRPLFLEFPNDEEAAVIDDEFLFGADLLVAPVLLEGASEREIYLPKGDWYDYWTGRRYPHGGAIRMPVTLSSLPLFVRGGAFIFRQPVVQHTGEMPGKSLHILIAPAQQSESALYEDDGESLKYRQDGFLKRRFCQICGKSSTIIEVSEPEGSYRPAPRDLILEAWTDREPQTVSVGCGENPEKLTALPYMDMAALATSQSGWAYGDGTVIVKDNDRFIPERFIIQR
jgi:alpha-glucosidase